MYRNFKGKRAIYIHFKETNKNKKKNLFNIGALSFFQRNKIKCSNYWVLFSKFSNSIHHVLMLNKLLAQNRPNYLLTLSAFYSLDGPFICDALLPCDSPAICKKFRTNTTNRKN